MLFLLHALCDLIVEAVFPSCAIFLLVDGQQSVSEACMSAMKSGKALQEDPNDDLGLWTLVSGSQAEGLTLERGWGHPWSDIDMMMLYGKYLGVNIGRDQPRQCQSPQSSLSATIFQGCHGNGCLEYVPEGCQPAFAKLRVTSIQELIKWNPFDLSTCLVQSDGHIWLNTARLNQLIILYCNEYHEYSNKVGLFLSISGPAGQVMFYEWIEDTVKAHLAAELWMLMNIFNDKIH